MRRARGARGPRAFGSAGGHSVWRRGGRAAPRRVAAAGSILLPLVTSCSETAAGEERRAEREAMVREQIEARGIRDPEVLAAMRDVPRHEFVPVAMRSRAYADSPLSIGYGQTISQPYIVAFMTEALGLHPGERVLEIGTGSGYQAAVLARLGCEVYSIEIVEPLAERAAETLRALGFDVHVRAGDGYRGWPEQAPFDAVIVTAAPGHVPEPLVEQLRPGGRMILPVGEADQELVLIEKTERGTRRRSLMPVRFVPLTGEAERRDR
ncbi:MAG: protein-L-isoaspartate(D-aspartate) O-methyltransferase [Planctomycetota bacterium]